MWTSPALFTMAPCAPPRPPLVRAARASSRAASFPFLFFNLFFNTSALLPPTLCRAGRVQRLPVGGRPRRRARDTEGQRGAASRRGGGGRARGGRARAASADGGAAQPPAEPVHDWLLADRAVQEAATSGQIKVGALGGWGLRARRPSGAVGLPGLAAYLK